MGTTTTPLTDVLAVLKLKGVGYDSAFSVAFFFCLVRLCLVRLMFRFVLINAQFKTTTERPLHIKFHAATGGKLTEGE